MIEQNVADVQHSNKAPDIYAAFCIDRTLYLANGTFTRQTLLARLPEIDPAAGPVRIYFHDPYICVSERFGLHAAVVDRRDGSVRHFERKDYHCDVSSYSIGFLENEGETLLIHQREWNRLDITNLQTGELITEREITYEREMSERANYLDYFHSLLHVSPDGRHFLSNGWMWHPVGNILCFDVEEFLKRFELANIELDYATGYNWDIPCTFIGNDSFVVSTDKVPDARIKYIKDYEYKQLWFYSVDGIYEDKLVCNKKTVCDCFRFTEDGDLWGEMYYDDQKSALIILSEKGGFIVSLEGKILAEYPDMALPDRTVNGIIRNDYRICHGWKYSPEHHIFYRFSLEQQKVVTRA